MAQDNFSEKNNDYALFLPAISSFFATFIGNQMDREYIKYSRIPFPNGMEAINFFNEKKGIFTYKWGLYSAGHAKMDLTKEYTKEDMLRKRDRNKTFLMGDSGGYQIGKGVWEGDWKNPDCPKAKSKRKEVLTWLDNQMDYAMILDIPAWIIHEPESIAKTGIHTYQDAVNGTRINNDYFMKHRIGYKNGGCKFLNVLQGETHAEADDWYQQMKDYCDPKQYPETHFDGWAMGGQNMCDIHLILDRLVDLHFDGFLQEGIHDWIHFLGTSRLDWAVILTDIQRAIRKHYNPKLVVSFDCASPFVAAANGKVYPEVVWPDRGKWTYRMLFSIDNKAFSTDTRPYKEAYITEKNKNQKKGSRFLEFDGSPVMDMIQAKDICCQGEGDLNLRGEISNSSWDSFSYAIVGSHNLWSHINAVQVANQKYDDGVLPKMLVQENYTRITIRDIINKIFAATDRPTAKAIIQEYNHFWNTILGSRGVSGARTINAKTQYNILFSPVDDTDQQECDVEDEMILDDLENLIGE